MPISSALCQFLPGPASSQVGFSIGLMRAGYRGALAAWTGFTLPSAIVLVLFAYGAGALGGPIGAGLLHGLKLVAVAIVAQAVWGMARTLCPDRERASIAVVGSADHSVQHLVGRRRSALLCSAASLGCGFAVARRRPVRARRRCRCRARAGLAALAAFFVLLAGLPILRGLIASLPASLCSTPSIAPARWCSAAAMSCCRCCAKRS